MLINLVSYSNHGLKISLKSAIQMPVNTSSHSDLGLINRPLDQYCFRSFEYRTSTLLRFPLFSTSCLSRCGTKNAPSCVTSFSDVTSLKQFISKSPHFRSLFSPPPPSYAHKRARKYIHVTTLPIL